MIAYETTIDDKPLEKSLIGLRSIDEKEDVSKKSASFFLFTDETKKDTGFQAFVKNHISDVLGFELCLLKEVPAGHTGAVDYLGLDISGKIFLIEVKKQYHDEQRAKFDVIFQAVKYFRDPKNLFDSLFQRKPMVYAKESNPKFEISLTGEVEKELIKSFPSKDGKAQIDFEQIGKRILNNLEGQCINVIIVVDKATPHLIGTANSLLLKEINSECRVIEMTLVKIAGQEYIYYRKYFTSTEWVDVNNPDNTQPELEEDQRLDQIKDTEIRGIFKEVVAACSKPNFYFSWNTANTSYFSTYAMGPNSKYVTLGVEFYTQQSRHAPSSDENILIGSIRFDSSFELQGFIDRHSLQVEVKHWPSPTQPGVNYHSFTLNPEDVRRLGSNEIVKLLNDYRKVFFEHRKK